MCTILRYREANFSPLSILLFILIKYQVSHRFSGHRFVHACDFYFTYIGVHVMHHHHSEFCSFMFCHLIALRSIENYVCDLISTLRNRCHQRSRDWFPRRTLQSIPLTRIWEKSSSDIFLQHTYLSLPYCGDKLISG